MKIVKEKARQRRLIQLSSETLNRGYQDEDNSFEILADMEATIAEIKAGSIQGARSKIHKAAEALEPQPSVDYAIKPLFAWPGTSLIVGEGGAKKTYSMIDSAISVAMGEPWLGFPTFRSPVLIVDEESGFRRLTRRIGDVMRGHSASPDIPLFYVSLAGFNLMAPADVLRLKALILEVGARFVVIDALADVMLHGDENLVKDVQPVFYNLRQISEETESHISTIHHANRNGNYRGARR